MYEQEPLQNNEFEQAEGEKVFKTFLPFGFTPKTFEEKRQIESIFDYKTNKDLLKQLYLERKKNGR